MTDTIANIFDDPSCHQIDTRLFFREVDVVDGGKRQGVVLATWNETYGNFALNCGEMERLLAGIHIDMDAFYVGRASSLQAAIDGYRFAQPDLRTGNMTHRLTLVPAIGRKA